MTTNEQRLDQFVMPDEIRQRAHELWENAGRPFGRDEEFWIEAEDQLLRERYSNGAPSQMPMHTHFLALPFEGLPDGSRPNLQHLVECTSETEAISRAEVMSAYPEYVGAIAVVVRRRNGSLYGGATLKASFGIGVPNLEEIFSSET